MAGLTIWVQYAWAMSAVCECGIIIYMLTRKQYRSFPAFFSYLIVDFLESVVVFGAARVWGFLSYRAMYLGWAMQGIVICARALAVAELCRHLLRQFRGIWGLAWRLLSLCAAILVLYSASEAGWMWYRTVLRMSVGLELTMLVVIVLLFLFARYYEIVADRAVRTMGAGFFALSFFKVGNDTILRNRFEVYADFWRMAGLLTFLVSLSLWFWALHKLAPTPEAQPTLLPAEIYRSVVPKINESLWDLNERLSQLWRVGAHGS